MTVVSRQCQHACIPSYTTYRCAVRHTELCSGQRSTIPYVSTAAKDQCTTVDRTGGSNETLHPPSPCIGLLKWRSKLSLCKLIAAQSWFFWHTVCEYVQVQKKLFDRLDELLRGGLPTLPLADLLTEVKSLANFCNLCHTYSMYYLLYPLLGVHWCSRTLSECQRGRCGQDFWATHGVKWHYCPSTADGGPWCNGKGIGIGISPSLLADLLAICTEIQFPCNGFCNLCHADWGYELYCEEESGTDSEELLSTLWQVLHWATGRGQK